ncbi:hypothetical protein CJF30_00009666 [Rutstroemia sp. NJR-2017a BBW]|nr:hypothetical protein CJF30_00009666 [Rutstroemia sp. NJR-2017a BBW]
MGGGPLKIDSAGNRCDWCVSLDFFIPEPDSEAGECTDDLWTPSFRLLADDVVRLHVESDVTRLGRLHENPYIDRKFLRSCYETCIQSHGSACHDPIRETPDHKQFPLIDPRPLPLQFRVIDVEESRVKLAPVNCSFAVLSYVWGAPEFLTLNKDNREELEVKNGLSSQCVPKTIAHAMEVARILSIRYLWVDALCILQNDEKDKASQIQQMDNIYSKAILTIVAASRTAHADEGLWPTPGQSRHFTQVVEEVQGLRFIGTAPALNELIRESSWHRRAWTYQESILSKRFFIFTEYQVYYSCEMANFAQDCIQLSTPDGNRQEAHSLNFKDGDAYFQLHPLAEFPYSFHNMVRDYTARHLSHESDGLNAISGVLTHFGHGVHEDFLCGLPVSTLFEYGMLWYFNTTARRRKPTSSGALFPSWSWVGWVGGVDWDYQVKEEHRMDARIIAEWSLEYDGGILHSKDLKLPSAGAGVGSIFEAEQNNHENKSMSVIQTGFLIFDTKLAKFSVAETYWNRSTPLDDAKYPEKGLYRIMHGDTWIGSVHLEASAVAELSIHNGTTQDFIALSKSGGGVVPFMIDEYPYNWDDPNQVYYYSETLTAEDEVDIYNVMMIIWEKGVAYRRGIGQVHKKSFEEAEWSMKTIRLG